jgi:hypothetical protein
MDQALAALDPDYKIHQVKQKFGYLRVYLAEEREEFGPALAEAHAGAAETCEVCGAHGELRQDPGGWLSIRCDPCWMALIDFEDLRAEDLPRPVDCERCGTRRFVRPEMADAGCWACRARSDAGATNEAV